MWRRAVRTKDGRLSRKPVLGDSGSRHCLDATSVPSSPDAHYSDSQAQRSSALPADESPKVLQYIEITRSHILLQF